MVILLPILITILILNLMVIKKIKLADYQNEERRKIHILMVWMIPIIGILMTKSYWRKPSAKIEIITKKDRKSDSGGFYESGQGIQEGLN
jgi:hypothetical protein